MAAATTSSPKVSPQRPNGLLLVTIRLARSYRAETSNKPFGRWGETFGDDVVAAAMIDRLVHHAEVVSLRGDSYRLKNRDLGRIPPASRDHGENP